MYAIIKIKVYFRGELMGGLFITLEGIDGAGKSTQAELLYSYLQGEGFDVFSFREPGGNNISEKIREIIVNPENKEITDMTEALLYAAARAQLVEQAIEPKLKNGAVVICDRFVDSSLVYQGIARNIGTREISLINKYATFGLVPDITFLLNLNYKEGIKRKQKQKKLDRIERESDYFYKKVYNGYLEIARRNKERIKVIDAQKDIDSVHNDIVKCTNRLIKNMSL